MKEINTLVCKSLPNAAGAYLVTNAHGFRMAKRIYLAEGPLTIRSNSRYGEDPVPTSYPCIIKFISQCEGVNNHLHYRFYSIEEYYKETKVTHEKTERTLKILNHFLEATHVKPST